MTRLFLPPEMLIQEQIIITGDQARYLSLVLRIQPGEQIMIFDGSGYRHICKVLEVHKKEVIVVKIKKELNSAEAPVSITLAQGLPKSDKMDLIVQKSTELGVSKIIPLITKRSQIRHTEKVERWRKIALSASQQSGRDRIPEILEPAEFAEFINNLPSSRCCEALQREEGGFSGLIFFEEHKERNLKKILTDIKDVKNLTLLIGPEGGFAKEEVKAAIERGLTEVSLGPRILRTETAPIAALSIIQYELGDLR